MDREFQHSHCSVGLLQSLPDISEIGILRLAIGISDSCWNWRLCGASAVIALVCGCVLMIRETQLAVKGLAYDAKSHNPYT
jgi:hypothetical protein